MVGFTDKDPLNYTYFSEFYHFDGVVITNTAPRCDFWKHRRFHSRIPDYSSHAQSHFTILSLLRIYPSNFAGPFRNRELG